MPDGVNIILPPALYLLIISLITAFVTVYDKISAKKSFRRVPEARLFLLALLGGSLAEYLTMRLIRHKTLHKSFMIGLPLIMLLQLAAILALVYFYYN